MFQVRIKKQIKLIGKKILTIFLCLLQIYIPSVFFTWSTSDVINYINIKPVKIALNYLSDSLVFAQSTEATPQHVDFDSAAQYGKNLGLQLIPSNSTNLVSADFSGISINLGNQTINLTAQQLFPDMNNTSDPHAEETFGTDGSLISLANSQTVEMNASESYTGEAYRTLGEAVNRPHMDESNKAYWDLTDQTFDDIFTNTFMDCTTSKIKTCSNATTHVPDYKICEEIIHVNKVCHCYHDYQINILQTIDIKTGVCGYDVFNFTIDLKTGNLINFTSTNGKGYEGPEVHVSPLIDTSLINSNTITKLVARLDWTGASCNALYDGSYSASISQYPTSDNNFIGTFVLIDDGGKNWYKYGSEWIMKVIKIEDQGWTCDPGCELFLNYPDGTNLIIPESYQCVEGPNTETINVDGVKITQDDLKSKPFITKGISGFCNKVEIKVNNFAEGPMKCWTDPQGVQHCPENPGDLNSTCEAFENDPYCIYIDKQCVEGAYDTITGICHVWDVKYDCGFGVDIENCNEEETYLCDGPIKCMGESCFSSQKDGPNTGFAKAAAAFQIAQYAGHDMNCASAPDYDPDHYAVQDGCHIFEGEAMECKKAVGGYVNCCEELDVVSIGDYIKLSTGLLKVANAGFTYATGGTSLYTVGRASWKVATSLGEKSFQVALADVKGQSIAMQQAFYKGAYNFLNNVSPNLANSVFTTYTEVGADGAVTTTYALTPGMQTLVSAVSFIMLIYTIYQIITILIQIIWECEEKEFELGAKRHLKLCHYVGSYCATDGVGGCIEKRESYCCFNSPFARILQEQVRPQLGMSWGSGENPDCGGLKIKDLDQVDWDSVDLSEWLALLNIAGIAPNQKDLSMENLTGSGSPWTSEGMERPDAKGRAEELFTGTLNGTLTEGETYNSLDEYRQDKWQDLWGQGD